MITHTTDITKQYSIDIRVAEKLKCLFWGGGPAFNDGALKSHRVTSIAMELIHCIAVSAHHAEAQCVALIYI